LVYYLHFAPVLQVFPAVFAAAVLPQKSHSLLWSFSFRKQELRKTV